VCSTPFGIRGLFSPLRARYQAHQGVLNAFRHQRSFQSPNKLTCVSLLRCSTPFGIRGLFRNFTTRLSLAIPRAQRLSASEVFSVPLNSILLSFLLSAQRLSASEVFSVAECADFDWLSTVLNAFRHQRSFQHYLDADYAPEWVVLNAFRHQRSFQRTA